VAEIQIWINSHSELSLSNGLQRQKIMKIAFILPERGRSGGVRCTVAVANKLRDRGHAVRILYQRAPITIRGLSRSIVNNLIYSSGHDGLQGFNGRMESFNDITKCSFGEKEVIVGVGMWGSAQLARLDAIPNPKLQYIHGPHLGERKLTEKTLSLPFPKVAVSSFLKPFAESFAGGGKVQAIIPNGVDSRQYFCSVDESQKNGIGTIYSPHPAKDPQTILAAIERLTRLKPDVPIRIFGANRRPSEIKPSSYWRYPSVAKARGIYSRSLVWIVASKWEGFGMPVLEAMACQCAVVATKCGGTEDIIVDGENGFLVEIGNVRQIVDRVELLLNDETLRKRLCQKAEETVKSFNWERSINELERVLKMLELHNNFEPGHAI
jgi:glycosyltransferase involved in cell wall biosynthesis